MEVNFELTFDYIMKTVCFQELRLVGQNSFWSWKINQLIKKIIIELKINKKYFNSKIITDY